MSSDARPEQGAEPPPTRPSTPLAWRAALLTVAVAVGLTAWGLEERIGLRGRAFAGILCFLTVAAACSANLRRVNWRTVGVGIVLQVALALFVLRTEAGKVTFQAAGEAVGGFLAFSSKGAEFVFGQLANPAEMGKLFPDRGFVFAFAALPTVIFLSAFFTLLFHLGILQLAVRSVAVVTMWLMRTSGAETLSSVANVFMGQTEAPLIVKPYVEGMTRSELLALMVGGMATVSGGVMALYISLGADPVAILATSVMAAPCGLYLSKLLLPEEESPRTLGLADAGPASPHGGMIDAISAGTQDGLKLALNIAAMLIAFIALVALLDAGLERIHPALKLSRVLGAAFAPAAYLLGVPTADVPAVADLLGRKLVVNEVFAYAGLKEEYLATMSPRGVLLASFALTGFANFSSIGIQLGGIGSMAESRRGDIARLGGVALLGGFLATLINAAVAGVLDTR
jgi:CNT family concentrative nucleoside transporter